MICDICKKDREFSWEPCCNASHNLFANVIVRRYQNDPIFNSLVNAIETSMINYDLTKQDYIDAVELADEMHRRWLLKNQHKRGPVES